VIGSCLSAISLPPASMIRVIRSGAQPPAVEPFDTRHTQWNWAMIWTSPHILIDKLYSLC
jgi:hypothetical protein